jgi:hypothetical protein
LGLKPLVATAVIHGKGTPPWLVTTLERLWATDEARQLVNHWTAK